MRSFFILLFLFSIVFAGKEDKVVAKEKIKIGKDCAVYSKGMEQCAVYRR